MDELFQISKRSFELDSDQVSNAIDLVRQRARIEGAIAFLLLLQDVDLWDALPEPVQDICIDSVKSMLGEGYEWVETNTYNCNKVSHRVATFNCVSSQLLLNLVPGGKLRIQPTDEFDIELELLEESRVDINQDFILSRANTVSVNPFLISKFPISEKQWNIAQSLPFIEEKYTGRADDWPPLSIQSTVMLGWVRLDKDCDCPMSWNGNMPVELEQRADTSGERTLTRGIVGMKVTQVRLFPRLRTMLNFQIALA